MAHSLIHNFVHGLFLDSKKNLWVATENGVSRYRSKTDDFQNYGNVKGYCTSFVETKDGRILTGHDKLFVYDKKTVVLSVLGTYFNGIILDNFIFDHNKKRRVCIITEKEEELRKFIINDLHSGATIYEAIGAYNFEKHNEIITIVDKSEYQKLMSFINREDPKAFITVYNVSNMQYQPKIRTKEK